MTSVTLIRRLWVSIRLRVLMDHPVLLAMSSNVRLAASRIRPHRPRLWVGVWLGPGEGSRGPGTGCCMSRVSSTVIGKSVMTPRPGARVDLSLAHPAAYRLGHVDTEFGRDCLHRRPLGRVVRANLSDHSDRTLTQLRGIQGRMCHGSIDPLRESSSTNLGVVHRLRSPATGSSRSTRRPSAPGPRHVRSWLDDGVEPSAIGVAARRNHLVTLVSERLNAEGIKASLAPSRLGGVQVGTMHRMKGLEFRCVAVIGVEEGTVPEQSAVIAKDEDAKAHAQDMQKERCLLFVACTRARDHLYHPGTQPFSPVLAQILEEDPDLEDVRVPGSSQPQEIGQERHQFLARQPGLAGTEKKAGRSATSNRSKSPPARTGWRWSSALTADLLSPPVPHPPNTRG